VRSLLLTVVSLLLVGAGPAPSTKSKHKTKSFRPIVFEKAKDYAGRYVGIDSTYWLDVRPDPAHKLAVTLHKDGVATVLEDVQLDGAHLTATSTAADHRSKPFDAVFGERNVNGRTAFGLVVSEQVVVTDVMTLDRLFCQRRADGGP